MSYTAERFSTRIGTGGKRERMTIITHGQDRLHVDALEPAMTGEAVSASPAAPTALGTGTWFFRNNGAGKSQFCVRFPSGAVQILATEP